ncbi:MAG: helix-turn-helix transcriptional regulator [Chthonomonas sp.]|nr:helix-turn-helix transcriptional regulator [Chthonomonas sp.]
MTIESIAKMLVEERRRLGITQAEVALLAGCSKPSVIAAERGRPNLRLETLVKIANVLGLDLQLSRGKRSA